LENQSVSTLTFDLSAPPNATIRDKSASVLVFNDINPDYKDMMWSQRKQTGDPINNGLYGHLIFHLEVCGIDLLYNTSSNWLSVLDTSGPCLTLPAFLFDRLRAHVPLDCPFSEGAMSSGKLCSPRRTSGTTLLPALSFRLREPDGRSPLKLHLPLERLVFRNATGDELLCVSRDDRHGHEVVADMMDSHIAFGSLAVSAFYFVVDLSNQSVGMASKANMEAEASEELCLPLVICESPMQTYYPPLNFCEDPACSEYMFMTLDKTTKTCKWTTMIPISFGLLLTALMVLDLVSHKLYKQAISKASEFC